MDRGDKSENPVPYRQIRTKVVRTLQNTETLIGCGVPRGDSAAMENPQCVSCKPHNTI